MRISSQEYAAIDRYSHDVPFEKLKRGTVIDSKYYILGELGEGGFATVYRAYQKNVGRDVAIKVLNDEADIADIAYKRFCREAKIASHLAHPNIVRIFDYSHLPKTHQPYIVMEYLTGHSLRDELNMKGPMAPRRAMALLRSVVDALSLGHQQGIVHKDLKPENLYLTHTANDTEILKILDFGVARISGGDATKLTADNEIVGTPYYVAPEYISKQEVTPAVDVYQIALIFSEVLSGNHAVDGSPLDALKAHLNGRLHIDPFLEKGRTADVFRKALSKDPRQRYQNAAEFGDALDSICDEFDRDSTADPMDDPDDNALEETAAPINASYGRLRSILTIILLVVIALAASLAIIFFL